MKILGPTGRHYVALVSIFLTTVALVAGMAACGDTSRPNFAGGRGTTEDPYQIANWYQLDNVRNYRNSHFILLNDLDSTTPGYEELASPAAKQGKGWQPIGTSETPFAGSLDGQGCEICDLFINRADEHYVGIFGSLDEGAHIEDIGAVNVTVIGDNYVGGLVGSSQGTVDNSYATGSLNAIGNVGGLFGASSGTVSNSYFTGNVTCEVGRTGGLVGDNSGTVSNSYSTGSVAGDWSAVGGLVGQNVYSGIVNDSYSTATVSGLEEIGGLVGNNLGSVSSSYSIGNVTGGSQVGGLVGVNYDGSVTHSYCIGSVTGSWMVGGLVADNAGGSVSNSYATGSVTGDQYVGGLVGANSEGTVSKSYSTGIVTGYQYVGGLVGMNWYTVSDSFWDTETSGESTSSDGRGKTTAEMRDIATFSDAGWNIVAVASPDIRNPSYIWNVVDGQTYPFLSWQPVV